MMMDLTRDELNKKYPHLFQELHKRRMHVSIGSIRTEVYNDTETLTGYTPDVIDFIRRCDTVEEAKEIIVFLEKQEQISQKYAVELRIQLQECGLRSFGPKKEHDDYLKRNKPGSVRD